MDPDVAWNRMLMSYAAKQWMDALEHAEALRGWLENGGFPPQPLIGATNGNFTCALDADFSAAICLAACAQVIACCKQESG